MKIWDSVYTYIFIISVSFHFNPRITMTLFLSFFLSFFLPFFLSFFFNFLESLFVCFFNSVCLSFFYQFLSFSSFLFFYFSQVITFFHPPFFFVPSFLMSPQSCNLRQAWWAFICSWMQQSFFIFFLSFSFSFSFSWHHWKETKKYWGPHYYFHNCFSSQTARDVQP